MLSARGGAPQGGLLGGGLRGLWLSAGEPMADDAAVELMKAVYGAGVTFWDTAEVSALCPLCVLR